MARLTDARVAAIKPPATGQEEHADDLVQGLRLRVGAGGRKAWIVRARAGGKVVNKGLGPYPTLSLASARDSARNFLITLAKEGQPRARRTFGELVDHWIDNVAKDKNKSWTLQKRRLEIHVLPSWRDRQLDGIRRADVRELVEGIEGDVNPNRVLTLVRTLFRYAMSRDWLEASPAEAITKPKDEAPRDRVLDMDEIRRVYAAADLLGYPLAGFVKLMVLTGQRRTEVASMRWDDIDLKAGTWVLPAPATKSARSHLVPLSAAAVALLEATPRMGDHVWTSDGSSHISGYAKAKTRLDAFLAAGGPPLPPWRFHDIRRSVATHMVRLGVLETVVGRVLNHASVGVTARVYALHSYEPEKRAALDAWAVEVGRLANAEV
ncbi:tyrosine-type recombinase/integrase [Sphingosinicella microcystinivorans]|uniref:tyrosine-type recombinase/integrase n=1 Tax=Sphingosinicella microcystinivorans TaxID=335406 RepID=UPI0022F3E33D|nr:site-specific integrase [Sphingosinicella microcystinivorans]WBX83017.1 tyrosine-type recombinase/integrase [Sphingosinicella microcystinivorans]